MLVQHSAVGSDLFYFQVYSVSNSTVAGALIGHDHSGVEQNFNRRLVDFLGLAQTCEENALSEVIK